MRRRILAAACLPLTLWMSGATYAQPDEASKAPTRQELIERLKKIEGELKRLKPNPGQAAGQQGAKKFLVLLETPFYGATSYYSKNARRYFAAKLNFVNLTNEKASISRDALQLEVDGEVKKLGASPPANLQNYSFSWNNKSHRIGNLKTPETIAVPAGGTASTWVVYGDLPKGSKVPKLVMKWTIGNQTHTLDVNRFALAQLGLRVERIGPHQCLGLVTIGGQFNTVNVGGFVDALDDLLAQKVSRVVVRWGEAASPLESHLNSWLQQAAVHSGSNRTNRSSYRQFPDVPTGIRELHVVQPPGNSSTYSSNGPRRIHETVVDAIGAALYSAYAILPRDELLKAIREGRTVTRAAALAAGGGRLPASELPLVLELTGHEDVRLQKAALTALRHFGEPAAIEKLLEYVRKGEEPLASAAIASLAGSRYAAAHKALLELLENEPPASRISIVKVLSQYPRPIWSETIYEFTQEGDIAVRAEAIKALTQVGHPRLMEVLKESLHHENERLRDQAFAALVRRADPESEQLALQFTLEHLKESPPTSSMYNLLNLTKDQRAVPLLLEYFKKDKGNRSQLIRTLQQIGDERVAKTFIEEYPNLSDYEKSQVLESLAQLQSPEFRKLAGEALHADYSSLVREACQGLQEDGSPAATKLLAEALEKTDRTTTMSYVTNALSAIGSSEARSILRKAQGSKNDNLQRYARNALRSMYQRSPGYQYLYQARNYAKQKNWQKAAAQFDQALKADSELPEAWLGRANARMHQNKLNESRKDYKKAFELDPYNSLSVTGLALAMVRTGDVEDGVTFVEKHAKRFENDAAFAYNRCCVYSRALEAVLKDENAEKRDERAKTYRKRALEELASSLKYGFNDKNLLGEDPDLDPLRELPEFKKIVPASKRAGARKLDGSDEGDAPADEGAAATEAVP